MPPSLQVNTYQEDRNLIVSCGYNGSHISIPSQKTDAGCIQPIRPRSQPEINFAPKYLAHEETDSPLLALVWQRICGDPKLGQSAAAGCQDDPRNILRHYEIFGKFSCCILACRAFLRNNPHLALHLLWFCICDGSFGRHHPAY